ncbi:tyrosine-type recombinase/integrase [Xenorhabdus sp. SF857]|uniref:phage integrase n=1 Tax=Xenorhabdus bakwenae TaxID=3026967 RepID=UPI0025582DC9|nr:tyrosine-type recombinase/integrase [Xenorhabdus sp. SF857]WFQ78862.1 tyrosine-type recombinase/integrase [Xenorhabdus sp. SF857]
MAIKKLNDGRYEVDLRPHGTKGVRFRRLFNRKSEAVAFERYTLAKAENNELALNGSSKKNLSNLIEIWWLYYGQNTENGAIEKRHLIKTMRHLNDPTIDRLTKRTIMEHRGKRLAQGITAKTINRDMYRLSGMFSTLIKIEEYTGDNPLHGLEPLSEINVAMTYLTTPEIDLLLKSLNKEERKIAVFCLSTGARWGEAENLEAQQVLKGRVIFLKTKNGKQRVVPISDDVEKEIRGRTQAGKLFKVDYKKFCNILHTVKPDLPKGQATHVLRHTFASHFMMNGGNIIALQQILGHASITQTMAYAHLAPDYLQHAITLNPLKGGIKVA